MLVPDARPRPGRDDDRGQQQDRQAPAGRSRTGSRRPPYNRSSRVTIRAKLYVAIVLTILGPVATIAVALHGMDRMGDRFDEVQERARPARAGARAQVRGHRLQRLADRLRLRRRRVAAALRALGARSSAIDLGAARNDADRPARGARCCDEIRARFGRFMALDRRGVRGAPARRRRAREADLPRPRARGSSTRWRAAPTSSPATRRAARPSTEKAFDDAREESRRGADRGGAGRRARDHPAARDRERHRAHGARERTARADDRRHLPDAEPAAHGRAAGALRRVA